MVERQNINILNGDFHISTLNFLETHSSCKDLAFQVNIDVSN